ncbi:MAG: hypothetical protein DMG65_06160 [Candidatus Angelobacter sp. Gp1-AA117]|nr:MAG: hypothetical protein DMG65_06160 [Candidatus Angelobacter sp. Gp1-AA117]
MSLEKIGRYEVVSELGRGAMGVVYKALDPTIGRTVALKTMRIDVHGLETEDILRRFKNEARAAGVLNHPNIVTIYDAAEQDGTFYMAMEYMEGTTLHSIMAEQRVLAPEEIIQISRQVCKGLDYAHSHGIVHRDIKPANMMITANGTVKIMDFGIAKAGGSMTNTGQVLGTPNYMSPEQVKGKPLDGRSDLFSFGVMLYEMVTGEKPFVGQNITTIIYKIVHENPIPPRDLDVTIHPGLSAVVTKALAKPPDERYQSGAELAHDLENYKSVDLNLNPTTAMSAAQAENTQVLAGNSGFQAVGVAPAKSKTATIDRPPTTSVYSPKRGFLEVAIITVLLIAATIGGLGYYRYRAWVRVQQQAERELQEARKVEAEARQERAAASTAKATEAASQPVAPPPVVEPSPKKEQEKPRAKKTPASPNKIYSNQGELRFVSQPDGAKVEVDHWTEPTWVTPFKASNLAAGKHTVSFSKPGYMEVSRTIDVASGKSLQIDAQLKLAVAMVTVTSTPPGANILIDGKDTGKTTPAELQLEKGEHTLLIRKRGYKEETFKETMAEGQLLSFSPVLPPLQVEPMPRAGGLRKLFGGGDAIPAGKGLLSIRTQPEGATIVIRDQVLSEKTNARLLVDPGTYDVILKMDGYKPLLRTINVARGKQGYIDDTLEKR